MKNREVKDEIPSLKKRIRSLEKEVLKLKSECRTLEIALAKNITVMEERAEHFKLEELIEQAKVKTNKP